MQQTLTLDDKYVRHDARVVMTGIQSLVRLPMLQAERDRKLGLQTQGFISGYRGSPIGGFDSALWKARIRLDESGIVFRPGLNEDLAATSCWGTQQLHNFAGQRVDGVFALWYGKGPGVDRSGDALKHANYAGTHPAGGVLAVFGDDHPAKSSTIAHQSEQAMAACSIPILYPSTVGEVLSFGIVGWEMSRYSGLWASMKCVNETLDRTETVDLPQVLASLGPPSIAKGGDHSAAARRYAPVLEERLVQTLRLPRVHEFIARSNVDQVIVRAARPRLGIVAAGKSYLDVRSALNLLGLSLEQAAALGISLYKPGLIWPIEPEGMVGFADGHAELLFIEEKRSFIESQARELFYNRAERPRIFGKTDDTGAPLVKSFGWNTASEIAAAILARLKSLDVSPLPELRGSVPLDAADRTGFAATPMRKPHFCSGCPHNRSTKLPEGSVALGGIGCHGMAALHRTDTLPPTHMGAEGTNWIGAAPFTDTSHVFQNLGDGTYFHSGLLAVRAAVAAGVNITYKILYNDAVALTGGQPVDGTLTVESICRQLLAEGIREVAIVSIDPDAHDHLARLSKVTVDDRDALPSVQERLRQVPGATAIIYDQACATELRRRRKRGLAPKPARRIHIHEAVCEGCGDCTVQSTCLSLAPKSTADGLKRTIDQSSCNQDYTCVKGFCPSFISVDGTPLPPKKAERIGEVELPLPSTSNSRANILVAGVGGTGVVTVGALLATAALYDGKHAACYDMTGLSQKGGAVYSHVRIAPQSDDLLAAHIEAGEADLVLAADMLAASFGDALEVVAKGRSFVVANTDVSVSASEVDAAGLVRAIGAKERFYRAFGEEAAAFVQAGSIARKYVGDAIGTNLVLLGYAWQLGRLPLSLEGIESAIRLNGVAVDLNLEAFRLGRIAAVSPSMLEEPKTVVAAPVTTEARIARARAKLVEYQGEAYARRFDATIAVAISADVRAGVPGLEFAGVVADSLLRLMAYKDEYEVARLFADTDHVAKIREAYGSSAKLRFYLAPPLLPLTDEATGRPRKIELGSWMMPVYRLLSKGRFLRGTVFDIFGYTAERRMERGLIAEFEALVEELADNLRSDTYAEIVDIARLPQSIRGFGHVKQASVEAYRQQLADARAKLAAAVVA